MLTKKVYIYNFFDICDTSCKNSKKDGVCELDYAKNLLQKAQNSMRLNEKYIGNAAFSKTKIRKFKK